MRIAFRFAWARRAMLMLVFHYVGCQTQHQGGCLIDNCIRCRGGVCTVCRPGLYGLGCENMCPANCKDVLTCVSGYCSTKGCKDGWYGPKCRQPCTDGCAECNDKTGSCLVDATPDCPLGCYCLLNYCIRCKSGYKGDRCELREDDKYTTSATINRLTAGLIGVGLVLGLAALSACLTCYFCVKYRKRKSSSVISNRGSHEMNVNQSQSSSQQGDTADVYSLFRLTGSQVETSMGTSCHVTALPPSYDSIFSDVVRESGRDIPPIYERTSEL